MDNGGDGAVDSDIGDIRQGAISDAARRQVIEMWNQRQSMSSIARATNLTVWQVSTILKLWQKPIIEKRTSKR